MEKQILQEINRAREIMGLRLITEGIGDEVAEMIYAIVRHTDDITDDAVESIARNIRKTAELEAQAKNISLDNYLDDMLRTGNVSDALANTLTKAILTSADYTSVVRKLVKDTDPVLKNIKDTILDNDTIDFLNLQNSLKDLEIEKAKILDLFKGYTDTKGNGLSDEMIELFKKDIDDATEARKFDLEAPGRLAAETVKTAEDKLVQKAKELIKDIKDEMSAKGLKLKDGKISVDDVVKKFARMSDDEIKAFYINLTKQKGWPAVVSWLRKNVNPRIKNFLESFKFITLDADTGKWTVNYFKSGAIVFGVTGLYLLFEYIRTDEGEFNEMYNQLLSDCPKLKDGVNVKIVKDIKDNFKILPDWVISIVYDGQVTNMIYEDAKWYLDKKSNKPGEDLMSFNCNDAKVADKTFEELGVDPKAEKDEESKKLEADKNDFITKANAFYGTTTIGNLVTIDGTVIKIKSDDGTVYSVEKNTDGKFVIKGAGASGADVIIP